VQKTPGWLVLGQFALEVTALSLAARLLARPRTRRFANGNGSADRSNDEAAPIPEFITEVSDPNAHRYRLPAKGEEFFAGFYTDGRVRLATPEGKRFSGIVVDRKAVVADLGSDDSFEMEILGDAGGGMTLRVLGGPLDGQTIACVPLS